MILHMPANGRSYPTAKLITRTRNNTPSEFRTSQFRTIQTIVVIHCWDAHFPWNFTPKASKTLGVWFHDVIQKQVIASNVRRVVKSATVLTAKQTTASEMFISFLWGQTKSALTILGESAVFCSTKKQIYGTCHPQVFSASRLMIAKRRGSALGSTSTVEGISSRNFTAIRKKTMSDCCLFPTNYR